MYVRLMRRQDVMQVSQIDREAFPTEWPPTNFVRELENRLAYYIVACEEASATPEPDTKSVLSKNTNHLIDRLKGWLVPGNSRRNKSPTENEEPVLGYAGMWILADEAHITSIASRQENRRQGIGEALLIALIELAARHKARIVTLEVRLSNIMAQNLYLKYGFQKTGMRKGYYLDNKEDAIIMSTEYIGSNSFREHLRQLQKAHTRRWGPTRYEIETQNVKLG